MNSFWTNLYDSFKDRRYGGLFLSTILVFVGLLLIGVVFKKFVGRVDWSAYFPEVLSGIGILALACGLASWRRKRAQRRNKLRYSPLSRDELRAARSKLRNGMKPINRPAPRSPDTFLKY